MYAIITIPRIFSVGICCLVCYEANEVINDRGVLFY
jgi:hypothetical protein